MSDGLSPRSALSESSLVPFLVSASITQYLVVLVLSTVLPLLGFAAILTAEYASAERRVVEAQRADVGRSEFRHV